MNSQVFSLADYSGERKEMEIDMLNLIRLVLRSGTPLAITPVTDRLVQVDWAIKSEDEELVWLREVERVKAFRPDFAILEGDELRCPWCGTSLSDTKESGIVHCSCCGNTVCCGDCDCNENFEDEEN